MFRYLSDSDFGEGFTSYGVTMMVRTSGGDPRRLAGAVQREVTALDPDLPLFNVKTLERSHRRCAAAPPRFGGAVRRVRLDRAGARGGRSVRRGELFRAHAHSGNRHPHGTRRARRPGLPERLSGRVSCSVSAGLALGLAVAFALSRFTAGFLYGIVPTDPVTFVGVPAVLVATFLATIAPPRPPRLPDRTHDGPAKRVSCPWHIAAGDQRDTLGRASRRRGH